MEPNLWIVSFNDGVTDVYYTPQPPPCTPYVDYYTANARIAELEAQLASAQEQGRWIPTERYIPCGQKFAWCRLELPAPPKDAADETH